MSAYYVYLWLREDGTPYYVGKGRGRRGFLHSQHVVHRPVDNSRISILPMPDEDIALAYECYLIDFWGRKDLATGCLYNHTHGGDKPPVGLAKGKRSPEVCAKLSLLMVGKKHATGHVPSKEVREAWSKIRKGRPSPKGALGKHWKLSDATRARQSAAQKKRFAANAYVEYLG